MARAKRVLVIGLGRFGRSIAEGIMEAGGEVFAVDITLARVEAVRDTVTVAAQIESVEAEALEAIGAVELDAAVVAIGEDFAAEVLAVALLKELGVEEIVARAQTDRERRILERVGATRVVMVEAEMGQRVARSLVASDVLDAVSLGNDTSIIFWTADGRVIGKRLEETELASRWHLHLVAIRTGDDKLEIPAADRRFRQGDVLLLMGADTRLASFTR